MLIMQLAMLYISLVAAEIGVFNDDDPTLIGKDVDHEICNAIDHCKISIPILSEDYASSRWCLDQLAQMVECKRTKRQKILPIFYKVRTSHVRDLSGVFGERMLKHEKMVDECTYEWWKLALKEVGSFKGWVLERIANNYLLSSSHQNPNLILILKLLTLLRTHFKFYLAIDRNEGVLVKEVIKEVSRLLKNSQTHDPSSLSTEY